MRILVGLFAATVFIPVSAQTIPELTQVEFLRRADFSEASGASFQAQVPQDTMMLYDKSRHSNVHYTAEAARTIGDGVHRIWYSRVVYRDREEDRRPEDMALCLGEIRNDQWSLVQTSPAPAPWQGINNIVRLRTELADPMHPHQIVDDTTGGLLRLYFGRPVGGAIGLMRSTAPPEGIHWTDLHGTVFNEPNDAFSAIRVGTTYHVYQTALQDWPRKPVRDNLPRKRRVITLRTSNDSTHWSAQTPNRPMLQPDAKDARNAEFYALKVFRYGSGFGGLLWKYYADPAKAGAHSSSFMYELITSGDGIRWERPDRDTDIQLFSYADPIHHAARLSFPARSDDDLVLRGWPEGRMIAVVGNGATVRTQPFYFPSAGVYVNADTRNGGWVDVALCDPDGNPIRGWAAHRISDDDGLKLPLPWKAGHEPVSLRFTLGGGAKLFGFGAR